MFFIKKIIKKNYFGERDLPDEFDKHYFNRSHIIIG